MKSAPLLTLLVLLHCTAGAAPIIETATATDGLEAQLGGADPFTTAVHRAGGRSAVTGTPYAVSSEGLTGENSGDHDARLSVTGLEGLPRDATVRVASNLPSLATFTDATETNREDLARRIGNRAIDAQTPTEEEARSDPPPGVVTILNVLFGVGILVILLAKFRNG